MSEQTRVPCSQETWVHRGKAIVLRGRPNVGEAQRHGPTSEHRFDGPAESPQALGTSSSSDEEAVPVATGFRERITEPPHPRDRQMDDKAKAFQPPPRRRLSLRMPASAAGRKGPIRRHDRMIPRGCPHGQLGESAVPESVIRHHGAFGPSPTPPGKRISPHSSAADQIQPCRSSHVFR